MANTTPSKKWYVFNEHDCMGSDYSSVEAAQSAHWLSQAGLNGVHIVLMTEAQFDAYCNNGDLRAALKL